MKQRLKSDISLRFYVLINLAVLGDWQQRIPIYAWITALIESINIYVDSFVFPDYSLCVVIRIE
jgi:hypothetical protein